MERKRMGCPYTYRHTHTNTQSTYTGVLQSRAEEASSDVMKKYTHVQYSHRHTHIQQSHTHTYTQKHIQKHTNSTKNLQTHRHIHINTCSIVYNIHHKCVQYTLTGAEALVYGPFVYVQCPVSAVSPSTFHRGHFHRHHALSCFVDKKKRVPSPLPWCDAVKILTTVNS